MLNPRKTIFAFLVVVLAAGAQTLQITQLPVAKLGKLYKAQLQIAASGTFPFQLSVTAGKLPDGLVLSQDGTVQGTPVVATREAFGVTVVDAVGRSRQQMFEVEVAAESSSRSNQNLTNTQGQNGSGGNGSGTPEKDSDFDLVLGVGSLIVGSDVSDYKVNSQTNVFDVSNVGRATPQLLTGGAFKLPFGNFSKRIGVAQPWYSFVSLKFAPDSSQTFSGYVVGGSYKISKSLAFLAGFALTPVNEPSPGFRAAAVQAVSQNPNVPIYQRFNLNALQSNSQNAFDGFPTFAQTSTGPTTTRLFNGNPTVTHYRGGLVIGVSIPISLKAQLSGGQKSSNSGNQ